MERGPLADDLAVWPGVFQFVFSDPEGWFYWGACFALVDDADPAIDLINRAVGGAYGSVAFLELPFFDSLRGRKDFAAALAAVHKNRAAALATYREAGGPRILGTKDE